MARVLAARTEVHCSARRSPRTDRVGMLGKWHPSPRSTRNHRYLTRKIQLALLWWVRSARRALCRHPTPSAATKSGGDVHPVADNEAGGFISRPARDLCCGEVLRPEREDVKVRLLGRRQRVGGHGARVTLSLIGPVARQRVAAPLPRCATVARPRQSPRTAPDWAQWGGDRARAPDREPLVRCGAARPRTRSRG